MAEINWPFGAVKSVAPSALTGAVTIKHVSSFTWAKFSGNLTAAVTGVTLTSDSITPNDGDILVLEIPCGSTKYDVTLTATPFKGGATITGVASKTVVATFIANGGTFALIGTATQS